MTLPTVWNEELQIRYADGDYYRRWKLSSLFQTLQECATQHALHLGRGYDQLIQNDVAWVLSRFKMRIESLPLAGERVKIETWPKGLQQKLFFMRDFLVTSAAGDKVYARASSAWLLIDTRTRRMQMPTMLGNSLPDNGGRFALDEPLDRIAVTGVDLQEQFVVQARSSMIDLMGHVTSARYIEWLMDCFPVEAYRSGVAWLQLNVNHEIKPGEHVSVASGKLGEATWIIQGTNLDTSADAFVAAVGFNQPG
ncbi:MAG: acyl-ACP thioesterase domain-containing protein [Anaerolineaceae bacterium]|jgi:acyl-ACP thioesterase